MRQTLHCGNSSLSFAAYQAASGQDGCSKSSTADFENIAADLHLKNTAMNQLFAGTALSSITDDIDGDKRNVIPGMGADELKINVPVPVVSNTGATAFCQGGSVMLTSSLSSGIQWQKDGTALPGETAQTYTANQSGSYKAVYTQGCIQTTSNAIDVAASPVPALSLQKTISSTFCDGQTVSIKASYAAGNIAWSTGETTDAIDVKTSGTYTATVKTAAGCQEIQRIDIAFLPNPELDIPDTTICDFGGSKVTLTAPPGMTKYLWNGMDGNQTFDVSAPGTITLAVTDENGCTAAQSIEVKPYCVNIKLANTFTPNGDGINDSWAITGMDNNPGSYVKVYSRYGKLVFESKGGYPSPWNGQYEGEKLPTGSYYYVISNRSNNQLLSGWLTIVY